MRYRLGAIFGLLLGFVALSAQADEAPPQAQAQTSMIIGTPVPDKVGNKVTVPITLILGNHDSAYTSFSLMVENYGIQGKNITGTVPHGIPPYKAPSPGKSVILNVTFTPVPGRKHRLTGCINYMDGAKNPQKQQKYADIVIYNAK